VSELNETPDAQSVLNAHATILTAAERFLVDSDDANLARLEASIATYCDLYRKLMAK
jgi:hypothetical protein